MLRATLSCIPPPLPLRGRGTTSLQRSDLSPLSRVRERAGVRALALRARKR